VQIDPMRAGGMHAEPSQGSRGMVEVPSEVLATHALLGPGDRIGAEGSNQGNAL
jgi:hypothetical protein